MKTFFLNFSVWTMVLFLPMISHGQSKPEYPNRPITIVVGFSAGGSSDVIARIISERLALALGQPVVVENKAGVGSIVGATYVAHAKPDGYTLFFGASGPLVFNHVLYEKLPYSVKDFSPISLICTFPLVLLTSTSQNFENIQDLIGFAKRNPRSINYSASSSAFQLATELFNKKMGTKFAHIPYKGSNDSIAAIMSNDVTMSLVDAGAAAPALHTDKVKALAMTSSVRLSSMPNVPTMNELGIELNISFWTGLMAPAGTPSAVISRLQDELSKILVNKDVKNRLFNLNVVPTSSTPEELNKLIYSEISMWRQVALDNNIKAE